MIDAAETKTCRACGQSKPFGDFYLDRGKPRHDCKECNKASRRLYRSSRLEHGRRKRAEYRALHPDRVKESKQRSRDANIEYYREVSREHYRNNRERANRLSREYRRRNFALCSAIEYRKRAGRDSPEGNFSDDDWAEILALQDFSCLLCFRHESQVKLTIDHIIPVSLGGSNAAQNIQALCHQCNSSKHDSPLDLRGMRTVVAV